MSGNWEEEGRTELGEQGGGASKVGGEGGMLERQQEMIAAITAIFKHAFPLI